MTTTYEVYHRRNRDRSGDWTLVAVFADRAAALAEAEILLIESKGAVRVIEERAAGTGGDSLATIIFHRTTDEPPPPVPVKAVALRTRRPPAQRRPPAKPSFGERIMTAVAIVGGTAGLVLGLALLAGALP